MARVPAPIWRYIQFELFRRDAIEAEISQLREDILHSTPVHEVGGSSGPGDPTGAKAVKLVSSAEVVYLQRILRAIDAGLRELGNQDREVYEALFRQGRSWQETCMVLNLSDSTVSRSKRRIILAVGRHLGVIKS